MIASGAGAVCVTSWFTRAHPSDGGDKQISFYTPRERESHGKFSPEITFEYKLSGNQLRSL